MAATERLVGLVGHRLDEPEAGIVDPRAVCHRRDFELVSAFVGRESQSEREVPAPGLVLGFPHARERGQRPALAQFDIRVRVD